MGFASFAGAAPGGAVAYEGVGVGAAEGVEVILCTPLPISFEPLIFCIEFLYFFFIAFDSKFLWLSEGG